jgi:hypothetical protein
MIMSSLESRFDTEEDAYEQLREYCEEYGAASISRDGDEWVVSTETHSSYPEGL